MEFGKNCSKVDCKQLDFLPITCKLCGNDFCMNHSEYSSHGCKPIVESPTVNLPLSYPCTMVDCKEKCLTPIYCNTCGRLTCIKHKQKEMHECSSLNIIPKVSKPNIDIILLKQQLSTVEKPVIISKRKNLTDVQIKQKLKINLIKLKMNAKSPKNCYVPDENKWFFQIMDKQTNKNLFLIANKKWSFSRIYDYVVDCWNLNATKVRFVSEFTEHEVTAENNIGDLLSQGFVLDGDNILLLY